MSQLIGVLCTLTTLLAAALGMRGRTTIALAGNGNGASNGSGCGLLECRGGYIWNPGTGQMPCPQCNPQGGGR